MCYNKNHCRIASSDSVILFKFDALLQNTIICKDGTYLLYTSSLNRGDLIKLGIDIGKCVWN